jgi:hypothetical protein
VTARARRFARNTTVDAGKSRLEIEATLARYGVSAFSYAMRGAVAIISFEIALH